MLQIQKGVDISSLNTLALPSVADNFYRLEDDRAVPELVAFAKENALPILWLGGGSNLVLAETVPGLVVHINTKGVKVLSESDDEIKLEVAAGECWHQFVDDSVSNGWFGLENLALIPGTVGAAPVQNIGAYGVEFADRCIAVNAFDTQTNKPIRFEKAACDFAYRESIFKRHQGRYLITSIEIGLHKFFDPKVGYAALSSELESKGISQPTARDVFDTVVAVRQSKLPDPAVTPNAGSFFKNPVVTQQQFQQLLVRYPKMPSYPDKEGIKLAAGWLIDQAGFKGFRDERAGVHTEQALVLINHEGASRTDVHALVAKIKTEVLKRFQVELVQEPINYPA